MWIVRHRVIKTLPTSAGLIACVIGSMWLIGCAASDMTVVQHPPDMLKRLRVYGPDARTLVLWPDGSGAVIVGDMWRRSHGFPPGTLDMRELVASLRAVAGPPQSLHEAKPPRVTGNGCHFREYVEAAPSRSAPPTDSSTSTDETKRPHYYPIADQHADRLSAMIDKAMARARRTAKR